MKLEWVRIERAPVEARGGPADSVADAFLGYRRVGDQWMCAGILVTLKSELVVRNFRDMRLGGLVEQGLDAVELLVPSKVKKLKTRPRAGFPFTDHTFYRQVAVQYRRASKEHPRDPVRWLAKQLDEPDVEKVRRWVRKARTLTLLGKPE